MLDEVPQYRDLIELSKYAADQWMTLGVALGMQPYKLRAIDQSNRSAESCAREVLMAWQRREGVHKTNGDLLQEMLKREELIQAVVLYAEYVEQQLQDK